MNIDSKLMEKLFDVINEIHFDTIPTLQSGEETDEIEKFMEYKLYGSIQEYQE